jgi:predicted nucleic acid-binding protein
MLFFERINEGELSAFINNIVFTETLFNFVKAKIIISKNIRGRDFIRVVKSHPEVITEVDISPVLELFDLPNLFILDLPPEAIRGIGEIHLRYGLLSNDAYHLLTMKHHGISDIATNDPDFEQIEWIKVWKT